MAFVTMPADHCDDDLALATRLVDELDLKELHVFVYACSGCEPEPHRGLLAALDDVLERVADLLAPWTARQPKIGKLRRLASRSTPAWSAATTSRSLRST